MLERTLFVEILLLALQSCYSFSVVVDPFSGVNYAINKSAHQEPETLLNYTADLAVNGITNTDFGKSNCSHTYGSYSSSSAWTVELGLPIYVTGIIIYNRKGYEFRLQNFTIYGLTKFEKEVVYEDTNRKSYHQEVIHIAVLESDPYHSIQIWIPAREQSFDHGETILTLCEVELYGVPGCESPVLKNHVRISSSPERNTVGSFIILTCETGYEASENTIITCNNNSEWTGLQPSCNRIRCPPPEIENGDYLLSNDSACEADNINDIHYLCKIQARCVEGYRFQNQSEITCQENGQWTTPLPTCDIVTCNFPGEFSDGKYVTDRDMLYLSGKLTYGTKIKIQCEIGFPIQDSMVRVCSLNGTWSGHEPHCKPIQCSFQELGNISNGHYTLNGQSEFYTGFANYRDTAYGLCATGFRLVSDSNATCQEDGTWSSHSISCAIVTCLPPAEIDNIKIQTWYPSNGTFLNEFLFGSLVEVTCLNGFLKTGSRIRRCTKDGSWDGEEPVCETHEDSNKNSYKAMVGGLSGGLVLAVITIGALSVLVFVLIRKSKQMAQVGVYTSCTAKPPEVNVENEYAKMQEASVSFEIPDTKNEYENVNT